MAVKLTSSEYLKLVCVAPKGDTGTKGGVVINGSCRFVMKELANGLVNGKREREVYRLGVR